VSSTRCNAKGCGKFCLRCFGLVIGLPLEHFVWEHTPYALALLRLIGVSV